MNFGIEGPKIAIVLCTFNGEKYLSEQLQSIKNQTFKNWFLYLSDDGSQDQTKQIASDFLIDVGKQKMSIRDGPRTGYAKNFFHNCKSINKYYDYFAFCDQDDLWLTNKLERAIAMLNAAPERYHKKPKLYCSVAELIDENGVNFGHSSRRNGPSFEHSCMENLAGGNTMVFDSVAKDIFSSIDENLDMVSHDWTLYQIASGCGGLVLYDQAPTIKYRIHRENRLGTKRTIDGRFLRLSKFFKGIYRKQITANICVLKFLEPRLTDAANVSLNELCEGRGSNFWRKLVFLLNSNFKRTSHAETLLMKIGNLFGLL